MRSSQRPCLERRRSVWTRATPKPSPTPTAIPHGTRLGVLLTTESDRLKERNRRRAKLRSIANTAAQRGDHAKAPPDQGQQPRHGETGPAGQLGTALGCVRKIFTAVHEVVDKAATIVAEDLTKRFTPDAEPRPKHQPASRRVDQGSHRRGPQKRVGAQRFCARSRQRRLHLTNLSPLRSLGRRSGDRFHCQRVRGGVAGRRERRDQHPAKSRRPRHRPVHPTPRG